MSEEPIINRVADRALISIDLEDLYDPATREVFDIKPLLFQELIIKERDFRVFAKEHDWSQYEGKNIAVVCSVDAIIPMWANMLLISKFQPVAKNVVFGDLEELNKVLFYRAIDRLELDKYKDERVVVKGCSKLPVPIEAYTYLSEKLTPLVKGLMYGEPCSMVPVYRKR